MKLGIRLRRGASVAMRVGERPLLWPGEDLTRQRLWVPPADEVRLWLYVEERREREGVGGGLWVQPPPAPPHPVTRPWKRTAGGAGGGERGSCEILEMRRGGVERGRIT